MNPAEIGPFSSPAPPGTATVSASVHGNGFDTTASPSTGDVVKLVAGTGFSPLDLQPGQSGTMTVTFTPSGSSGTVVTGFLDVDTFNSHSSSGDQVNRFQYSYRIR